MQGILPFLKEKHLNYLFLTGTFLILVGMPFSLALMSIGSIWISCVYILEGGYKEKIKALNNPILWVIFLFLLLHLLGMFWSQNKVQGWKELLKILPLFSIPVVFSGIRTVTATQQTRLLYLFVLSVFISIISICFISIVRGNFSSADPRELSIFTSHIRLALFVCFSLFIVLFSSLEIWIKTVFITVFLLFVWKIQSLTGVIILGVLLASVLTGVLKTSQLKSLRWLKIFSLLSFVLVLVFISFTLVDYYSINTAEKTPAKTANGGNYNPELENGFIENGNYLWSYVSYPELEKGFSEKTGRSIWDKGNNGFAYYGTLIRYLNNLGYSKDLVGLMSLEKKDYERILKGNPYPDTWKYKGFSKRIRGLLFHIEKSKFNPDFSGNSIAEKAVFQAAGWHTFLKNPVFGAGTGDLKLSMAEYYTTNYPHLEESRRRKPHNQYLTILIKLGPIGLILFIMLFYLLWIKSPMELKNISRAFLIIILVSCLGEDTIENQAGITFFSTFIGLLFLLRPTH